MAFGWAPHEGTQVPYVNLNLGHGYDALPVAALFDTGSTVSILNTELQNVLGVSPEVCRPTVFRGFGSPPLTGQFAVIDAQMVHEDWPDTVETEGRTFQLPVIFARVRTNVFGRAGLMDHFHVTFDSTEQEGVTKLTWKPADEEWLIAVAARVMNQETLTPAERWWERA